MKDGQYIHIEGWMGNQVQLRANDLICFALIYGFSHDGKTKYSGGLDYLASCMFATKPTVLLCLNKLSVLNLILKTEKVIEGKKRCFYQTNIIYEEGKFDVVDSSKEPLTAIGKEPLPMTGKEPLPDTYYNKNYNNKEKRLSNDNQKEEGFDKFWETYDYKKGKVKAESAWKKLTKVQKEEAIKAIPLYKEDCKRNDRQMKHPATYLNQKTWEDDFTCNGKIKEEKEESAEPEISEAEAITWRKVQEWMAKKVPGLKDRITYDDFCEMRSFAHFKSDVYADILMEIEKEGCAGNIVDTFDNKCQGEFYDRIWDNG